MSEFSINTKVFFGQDAYSSLYAFLKESDYHTFIAIIDDAILNREAVQTVLSLYKEHGYLLQAVCPFAVQEEPTYDQLDAFVDLLSYKTSDFIVAIGGGSVIDLAKGVGVLLKNSGKGIDYRGMHKVMNPGVPVIAYPSTAGTGSEVTWTAAFIDTIENKKLGINGQYVAPLCGVLDPRLVATCPRHIVVSSGLDAMVHAAEAVTATTATDMTKLIGVKAFAMIYQYLPICLNYSDNLQAWSKLQLAAYLAGVALMNAGGGPASAVSYPLGVHYKVPHGIAGGIFLRGVFEINTTKGYLGYASIYDELFDANHSLNEKEKTVDFINKFNQFYDRLNAPRDLKAWRCEGRGARADIVRLTMEQRLQNIKLNPVHFTEEDVQILLENVCV